MRSLSSRRLADVCTALSELTLLLLAFDVVLSRAPGSEGRLLNSGSLIKSILAKLVGSLNSLLLELVEERTEPMLSVEPTYTRSRDIRFKYLIITSIIKNDLLE